VNILVYTLTAGLLFTLYLYYQLRNRVDHMDEWLDDNFGNANGKEVYIIKEEEEDEKS
jgi:hypothetical protein